MPFLCPDSNRNSAPEKVSHRSATPTRSVKKVLSRSALPAQKRFKTFLPLRRKGVRFLTRPELNRSCQ